MIKEEKVIISNDINIGATIAYKDKNKKRPLVLLIMGTGTTDRDGNSFGFKTNLYKNLSDMFVEMGYVLNKSILSEEEQNQILFALQGMKKVRGKDEKDILEKLSTLFNKEINDWIKIDFSNWGKDNTQEERFDIIKTAILNKNQIEFVYYNSNGEESKRTVEPLQIWFKDKSWYLISYCKLKEDYRIFKIARIKEIKILQEHFERELPKEKKEEKYNFKNISLELEISKEMAYRVYDEFDAKEITKKEDGNFIVNVEYPENEWVYGYILSFGEYAKILKPDYAKTAIKEKLQKTLKNYL